MKRMMLVIFLALFVLILQGTQMCVLGQSSNKIYAEYDKSLGELRIIISSPEKITVAFQKSEIDTMKHDISFKSDDGEGLYVFSNLIDTVHVLKCDSIDAENNFLHYYINKNFRCPLKMEVRILSTEKVSPVTVTCKDSADYKVFVKKLLANKLFVFITILVLFALSIVIIVRTREKRKQTTDRNIPENQSVMTVVEEKVNNFKRGLEHVMANNDDYYKIDMNDMLADTTIRNVYISSEVIKKLNMFFREFLESPERTNETGCYMIGCWDYVGDSKNDYDISIEYVVEPGKDAVFEESLLNFGREIGLNLATMIEKVQEKTGKEYVRTCWMHSHPGLGLFLSSHDIVVQKQLAYSEEKNRLLAIVIDTNSPDWSLAMFCPKHDGDMNNKIDLKKTLSFDNLYKWSKDKKMRNQTNSEYFTINVGSMFVETVNFSGKTINQIDDAVGDSCGVSLYFYGTKKNKDIYIDKCLQNKNVEALGCLLNNSDSNDKVDVSSLMSLGCEFFMVCNNGCDIQIFAKENEAASELKRCETTLGTMIEWTRRKRF